MRIAAIALDHETNTFSALPTHIEDFFLLRGEEMLQQPVWSEFIDQGVEWAPILSAVAIPRMTRARVSGRVVRALCDLYLKPSSASDPALSVARLTALADTLTAMTARFDSDSHSDSRSAVDFRHIRAPFDLITAVCAKMARSPMSVDDAAALSAQMRWCFRRLMAVCSALSVVCESEVVRAYLAIEALSSAPLSHSIVSVLCAALADFESSGIALSARSLDSLCRSAGLSADRTAALVDAFAQRRLSDKQSRISLAL